MLFGFHKIGYNITGNDVIASAEHCQPWKHHSMFIVYDHARAAQNLISLHAVTNSVMLMPVHFHAESDINIQP
jgi:hypothetical protein